MQIELKQVSKSFSTDNVTYIKALQKVDLIVRPKDFVTIVGANGSGKSTLLNAIAGSAMIDEGSIEFDGKPVHKLAVHQRSKYVARIFQNPLSGTAPSLHVIDNFRLAALRTKTKLPFIGNTKKFEEKISDIIKQLGLGLEDKLHQPMGSLSGGQRQALTLLMAVQDTVKVLLLDEPTAALDPKSAHVVMQTAQKLIEQRNLTAVYITHSLADAAQYGNRIIEMKNGVIAKDIGTEEKKQLTAAHLAAWFA